MDGERYVHLYVHLHVKLCNVSVVVVICNYNNNSAALYVICQTLNAAM